jgi:hypothetical protein
MLSSHCLSWIAALPCGLRSLVQEFFLKDFLAFQSPKLCSRIDDAFDFSEHRLLRHKLLHPAIAFKQG